MKIRVDFVTNSSSSSYVVIGRYVDPEYIDVNQGRYICVGDWLSDGQDVFDLTGTMLSHMKYTGMLNNNDLTFVEVYDEFDGDCSVEMTIEDLSQKIPSGAKFSFMNLCGDYHPSSTIQDLDDRYARSYNEVNSSSRGRRST